MTRLLPLFAALALMFLSGCGADEASEEIGKPSDQAGFETPEKAFEAIQKAGVANDFPGVVRCLSPESVDGMAEMITFPLAMIAAFDPEKEEEIKKLLAKHGVDLEDESQKESPFKNLQDKQAYIADVMKWLDENSDEDKKGASPLTPLVTGQLGEVKIDGDTAHGTLAAKGKTEDVDFARVGGRWFVQISSEPTVSSNVSFGGGDSESSFGQGFGNSDFSDFEPKPLVPLEAVSLDEFNSSWQVTMNVNSQPAGKLLGSLTEKLGMEFEPDEDQAAALQKAVSLNVTGKSRFEAIEEVCRQLEMTPAYSKKALTLQPGARTNPVVFVGPFFVELTNLETRTESATGKLELRVFSTGLPRTMMQQLRDGSGSATVEKAHNAKGEDLQNLKESSRMHSQFGPLVFDRQITVGLKHLLRNITAISVLEGQIEIEIPTAVTILKFDELKTGTEKKAGESTVKLSSASSNSYSFNFKGLESNQIQLIAYDESGKQLQDNGGSSFSGGGSGTISKNYKTTPARLEVRVISATEPLEYPFAMKEIAIPNAAQMPEKLAELSFEGDAPVTLEFVKIGGEGQFKKAHFKATNHSNKATGSLVFLMKYLDADGKVLKDTRTSHGRDDMKAGETVELEATAFFMPEETKSVSATLIEVNFADASAWKPEK
jgi:hypothetical protein